MALYPSCLQDGKFLVDFYVPHTSDARYNGINQRFWLQYHHQNDIKWPSQASEAHLLKPSDTSEQYASRHHLVPYRLWINLTHEDTYIHGPFEFARVRGRKTRDRIDNDCWNILRRHRSMYHNEPPRADIPSFSIHVDCSTHVAFSSQEVYRDLKLAARCMDAGDCLFFDKRS